MVNNGGLIDFIDMVNENLLAIKIITMMREERLW